MGMEQRCLRNTLYGLMYHQLIDNYGRFIRRILLLNIPPLIVFKSMACMIGLIVLAYYSSIQCDPLESRQIYNSNQLLPLFVMTIFRENRGFAGVFLATLYSGSLSSVSSSLSACSAIMWSNVIKPHINLTNIQESRAATINKITVVVFGLLSCALAFLASLIPGPITQVSGTMFGSIGGPIAAVFLLGGCFKTAEWIGTSIGCLSGLFFMMWVSIGGQTLRGHQPALPPVSTDNCTSPSAEYNYTAFHVHDINRLSSSPSILTTLEPEEGPDGRPLHGLENLYGISYVWYTFLGLVVSMVIGLTISYLVRKITKENPNDVPDELIIPFRKLIDFGCLRKKETTEADINGRINKENVPLEDVKLADPLLHEKNTSM